MTELLPLEGPDPEFDPTADPIKVARPLQDQKPERKSKPKGGHGVDRREGAQRKPLAPLPPSGGTRPGSSGDPPIGGPGGGGGGGIVAPPRGGGGGGLRALFGAQWPLGFVRHRDR